MKVIVDALGKNYHIRPNQMLWITVLEYKDRYLMDYKLHNKYNPLGKFGKN